MTRFDMSRFDMTHTWARSALTAVLTLAVAFTQAGQAHASPPPINGHQVPASAITGAVPRQLWEPPFGLPLRILGSYSLPNGPYGAGHRGIDLHAKPGDPVRMPSSGVVSFVGKVVNRQVLSVRLDTHTVVSFEPIVSELREGDSLARGAVVGEVATYDDSSENVDQPASSSHCASGCLHLGVRVDGEYVNPLRYLRPRPILLPW